jgi:hypothetical protein
MSSSAATGSQAGVCFPGWSPALATDESLSPARREAYRQTLTGFLKSCAQRRVAVTVAAAREFAELARLEHAPGPGRAQEWQDALNWYFRRGREGAQAALRDVPPLARTDQGQTAWEAALIAGLRERHLAWRTEQTCEPVEG